MTNPILKKERMDTMSELIKNQNFGVEIEMNGISRPHAQKVVARILGSNRMGVRGGYDNHYVIDNTGREWKCESDSSINHVGEGTCELVTPILQYRDIELLQKIVRELRAEGARTDSSCGIHVHVDGSNHNCRSLKNLVNFFYNRQDLIYEALEIGARKDRWCRPICQDLKKEIKSSNSIETFERIWYSSANDGYSGGIDHQHYNRTRYHALNLHAFFSKGTVEFRLFNSTLHAGKIKAYIQFCLAVSAWAIETERTVSFKDTSHYSPAEKFTIWKNLIRNRLGLTGEEFMTCRQHMLRAMKNNAHLEVAA